MRFHFFEFEDLSWFPSVLREGGTDYLRYFLNTTQAYQPAVSIISRLIDSSGEQNIIDLCSGGGGAIEHIQRELEKKHGEKFQIRLSDKYPNLPAFEYIKKNTHGKIEFIPYPVDTFNLPSNLAGIRTMFSAVHHFKPPQIKAILTDAVKNKRCIALFDGGDKNILMILGLLVVHPLVFFFFTPFFRPFKMSRVIFTYLIPLIPLMTMWDGVVSILRLYHPKELYDMALTVNNTDYDWEYGKKRNHFGLRISYLVGSPKIKRV